MGGQPRRLHGPERRWSEWNGRFRDDVRRFWRGDPGMLGAFAARRAYLPRHAGFYSDENLEWLGPRDAPRSGTTPRPAP